MNVYTAYHGTNSEYVESIKHSGFTPSTSHNEWLGYGVYFFVAGISCPIKNAREWAINNAWSKEHHQYTYATYSILKTIVSGDRVLDLRIEEDLKIFEGVREHILKRYEREKQNFRGILGKLHPDTFLCNSVTESLKVDILISNFYIKTKFLRIQKINSRIPNSTVLCAKETAIIDVANIEEIEKGAMSDE